ncbi:MAG: hypothetical protein MJ252_22145, partial [archaeon]|nr:hypothetical protein [archaeon]
MSKSEDDKDSHNNSKNNSNNDLNEEEIGEEHKSSHSDSNNDDPEDIEMDVEDLEDINYISNTDFIRFQIRLQRYIELHNQRQNIPFVNKDVKLKDGNIFSINQIE